MSKNKISDYSSTASNNTDIGGINISEGCPPSNINNSIRELMAQVKDFQIGAEGDGLTVGGSLIVSGAATIIGTATLGIVQASSFGAITATSANISAGLTVGTTATFGNISGAVLNDGYTEEVFAISDGASVELDPNNGSIQTWTLGDNRTPDQANWAAGQSITLMIDDGTAYTITWSTLAVTWKTDGGTAPTLNTSGFTVIQLWKVGSTIYGARVGDA